jgi:hypothetical protein
MTSFRRKVIRSKPFRGDILIIQLPLVYSDRRREGHHDEGEILHQTLEQWAYVGNGTSHSGLCELRAIHLSIVRLCRLHRDGGSWGGLLNGCRMALQQAVRLAKGKFTRPRSSQTEAYSPTQPDLCGIQHCLLDSCDTSLHPVDGLPYRLHSAVHNCHHQGRCQSDKEQPAHAGAG